MSCRSTNIYFRDASELGELKIKEKSTLAPLCQRGDEKRKDENNKRHGDHTPTLPDDDLIF